MMKTILIGIFSTLLFITCSSPVKKDSAPRSKHAAAKVERSQAVIPRVEPKSKYGNPPSYVVFGKRYYVMDSAKGYVEEGIASWYGTKFHGRPTSSQEPYDMYAMTAAHKSLPLPTYARVTNKQNGRSVIVRINDRGPFHDNRIIDLSYAAATKLGIVEKGTGLVEVRAIDPRTMTLANRGDSQDSPQRKIVEGSAEMVDLSGTNTLQEDMRNQAGQQVDIYVQVGAFRSRDNAVKLRSQFAGLDLGNVAVHGYSMQDEPIYKVRVGPLETVEQADATVEKISLLGHTDHKIVFKEQ
jgi:rare lipoprotein A